MTALEVYLMTAFFFPVYSLFGFAEYIVVISNIMFHLTTVYDLKRQFVSVSLRGIYLE